MFFYEEAEKVFSNFPDTSKDHFTIVDNIIKHLKNRDQSDTTTKLLVKNLSSFELRPILGVLATRNSQPQIAARSIRIRVDCWRGGKIVIHRSVRNEDEVETEKSSI